MPSTNNNKFSSLSSSLPSNPNPRNSEVSNPMRRSFTGNPFSKPSSVAASPRINFPITPANSPSEFPRRSSIGVRESVADDKENGKDSILKQAKVRSPAACSKSSKNFMSPTISASIKASDSPRKKILTERNEQPAPAASTPSAEPKSHARKVTFADPLEEKKLDAFIHDFPNFEEIPRSSLISEDFTGNGDYVHDDVNVSVEVPLIPVKDIHTEPIFETLADEPDCVNLDPTFKLSPMATPPPSVSSTVALLDADPLMLPYDPKTNYFSPRPQFLHYRPKPSMEQLEDSFMSGSFSDTEVTEDTQSEGSQKESEDLSSDETVKQEEEEISEPIPDRTLTMSEKTVVAKEVVPKPRFSMKSKAIALVLLLSVAFVSISVTNSPLIGHAVFEDFSGVYESSEFSEFARANFDRFSQFATENFDGLAGNLHIWFTKSLTSISELISNVRAKQNSFQLQYYNLTALDDSISVHQYPIFGHGDSEIGDTQSPVLSFEERGAASEIDATEYAEDISDEHYEVYEGQLQQVYDDLESEEVLIGQPASMIESDQALQLAEADFLNAILFAQEVDASFSNVEDASSAPKSEEVLKVESEQTEAGNLEDNFIVDNAVLFAQEVDASFFNVEDSSIAPQFEEVLKGQSTNMVESEQAEAGNLEENFVIENPVLFAQEFDASFFNVEDAIAPQSENQPNLNSEAAINIDTKLAHENAVSIDDAVIGGNGQRSEAIETPPGMMLYLLICGGTVLIAGAAFNWSRKGTSRSQKVNSLERPVLVKEAQTKKQISPENPSLRNGPIEMDVVGESCPSEMSSFQTYSTKVDRKLNEAHSLEKKRKKNVNRRESLASSVSDYSMSPSYGSLTVYEKIPGYGDEEIVTPVRRSSRIRNLATSPL